MPYHHVISDVEISQNEKHKIAYPHFEVEVIKKSEEFSECYQKETQQYLKIKNEFLYKRHHQTYCLDDYTDYFISAKKGDLVKVIGIYSHYAYVIHQGEVGWIDVKCINL